MSIIGPSNGTGIEMNELYAGIKSSNPEHFIKTESKSVGGSSNTVSPSTAAASDEASANTQKLQGDLVLLALKKDYPAIFKNPQKIEDL